MFIKEDLEDFPPCLRINYENESYWVFFSVSKVATVVKVLEESPLFVRTFKRVGHPILVSSLSMEDLQETEL